MFEPIIKDEKYITYDEKPVYFKDYNADFDFLTNTPILTIVMQGPLKLENHFTLETLKIYQKNFPKCPIVLSTWKTENIEEIEKIKELNIPVLQNDPPTEKGLDNINFQILSTQKGLQYAKENGAEWVIKTRTDQRLYETNIPEFLFNLQKAFPVYDKSKQKSRLTTLSMNTFKYRLYDISDMFLFGHIDDVIKFWSCDFEKRTVFSEKKNMLEYCKARPSEIYFTSEYLEKIGHSCKWNLYDSWLTYSRYFCVVDSVSVGLYWPKYSNLVNRWRNFFGCNPELEELTFKEWLNMYADLSNKIAPENLLVDGWEKIKINLPFDKKMDIFNNKKISIFDKVLKFLFGPHA